MHLLLRLDDRAQTLGNRLSLDHHYEKFGFPRESHPHQAAAIRSATNDGALGVFAAADLLASQIALMYKEELIQRDKFVESALRCCKDILIDMGFDSIDVPELVAVAREAKYNVILTPGCQSYELLRSRVRATELLAYDFCQGYQEIDIVFSGNNPGDPRRKPKIHNESAEMKQYFWELVLKRERSDDLRKYLNIDVLVEHASSKSTENIERFLAMKHSQLREASNIVVVSSSFHLIRLAQRLLESIDSDSAFNVRSLVLVGAETVPNRVSMLAVYVKSTIFEIYRHLLTRDDFWASSEPNT